MKGRLGLTAGGTLVHPARCNDYEDDYDDDDIDDTDGVAEIEDDNEGGLDEPE